MWLNLKRAYVYRKGGGFQHHCKATLTSKALLGQVSGFPQTNRQTQVPTGSLSKPVQLYWNIFSYYCWEGLMLPTSTSWLSGKG